MTICFKNQLNALADTHILIDGASRSWTKGQLFCLAEKLREYATGLDESHTAHTNRCLLLCEGTTSDIAVYIAAVIGGITVAPYSPSAFLRDPRYAIESIKPSLAIAPARFHEALMEDNIPYIFSQDDIVNVTTKADQAPTRDKEGWSLELDMEAYIIPTSGSTGRPKFVPITYRNIVSWATHNLPALQLDSTSRFGGTYPLYFDASAMIYFWKPVHRLHSNHPRKASGAYPFNVCCKGTRNALGHRAISLGILSTSRTKRAHLRNCPDYRFGRRSREPFYGKPVYFKISAKRSRESLWPR